MKNNRKSIAIAAVTVLIIGGVVVALSAGGKTGQAKPTPTPAAASFTGTDALIARGMSSQQLKDVEFAFYRYFRSKGVQPATVDISNVNHLHDGNADPTDALTFNVLVDAKTPYLGKATYSDISSVDLILTDTYTHQAVFDSGVIKVQTED